jgi:hypothetical protein
MDICHAYARLSPRRDLKRFACVDGDGVRVWALNPFQYRGWEWIRVIVALGRLRAAHFSNESK